MRGTADRVELKLVVQCSTDRVELKLIVRVTGSEE